MKFLWSLLIDVNVRSQRYVSSQRKLIARLTGPTPDNASFNQPKSPGWKDHIVGTPNLSAFGPGEDLLHLAPKHLLLCPSLSICECISEMFSEAVQGVLIDRPQIVWIFSLGMQTFNLCRTFPRNPARFTKGKKRRKKRKRKLSKASSIYRFIYSLRPWRWYHWRKYFLLSVSVPAFVIIPSANQRTSKPVSVYLPFSPSITDNPMLLCPASQ